MTEPLTQYPVLTEDEQKARKKRNLVLAWSIVAFMILILTITMVKLKEGVVRKQDWAAETGKTVDPPVVEDKTAPERGEDE